MTPEKADLMARAWRMGFPHIYVERPKDWPKLCLIGHSMECTDAKCVCPKRKSKEDTVNNKAKTVIEGLLKALSDASRRIEDIACTCVDRSKGHEKICSGTTYTAEYEQVMEQARKLLAEKSTGASFPMEYKGWKIEIKMGHEFKGTRGSVKNKRGYVATRISDGKVTEFPPSYDTNPSVQTVKIMIDMEERAEVLYKK
jgi:hypothetical protein